MNIGILGMGGIGSFIGAKLAKGYEHDQETKLFFICRNETKEAIVNNGLSLISDGEVSTSKPYLASDNPEEIEPLDLLIVATKSFSLATAIRTYQPCLKPETIIIPLQNGVDAKKVIVNSIQHDRSKILEGCIYIASNIEGSGVVKHVGGPGKIFFGIDGDIDYKWIENILVKAGLQATYTRNIKEVLWRKYLFVSPLAAMTTALQVTFGQIAQNPEYLDTLKAMMKEVQQLADKFDVRLTDTDIEDALTILQTFPHQSKSSLQLDFEHQNRETEKDNLVDYVIENGEKHGVYVHHYKEMNKKIQALMGKK